MSAPRQNEPSTEDELRKTVVTFLVQTYVLYQYSDSKDVYADYRAPDETETKGIVDGMTKLVESAKKENEREHKEEKLLEQFIEKIKKKTQKIVTETERLQGESKQKLQEPEEPRDELQNKLSQSHNEHYLNSGFALLAANCYLGYMLANVGTPEFKQNDELLTQFAKFLAQARFNAKLIELISSGEEVEAKKLKAQGPRIVSLEKAKVEAIKMLAVDFREKGDFAFLLMRDLCVIYFNLKIMDSSLHQEFFAKINVFNQLFNKYGLFQRNEQLLDALLTMHTIPLKERTDLLKKLNIPQDQISMFEKYSAKPRPKPSQIGTFAPQRKSSHASNDPVAAAERKKQNKKK
jgi:hypothetical protein